MPKITNHLSRGWWKHPIIDFGVHYPMPYIWFIYWMIAWGNVQWDNECWLIIGKYRIPRIEISFMPD